MLLSPASTLTAAKGRACRGTRNGPDDVAILECASSGFCVYCDPMLREPTHRSGNGTSQPKPPRDQLSRTMRIDLIPDVPSRPAGNQHIVVERRKAAESKRPAREDELEESHFQRLLQRLYDAAIIADLAGRIVDVNVRAEEFLRHSKSELLSMTIFDVIAGTDESVVETVCENLENERHTLIQAYCLRKDGSWFPAEIAVSKLDLGSVLLCYFVRDITVRRQAEEMLMTEHNAIQHSGSGIAVVDRDGRLEYANPTMEKMFREPAGLIGKDMRSLVQDQEAMGLVIEGLLQGEEDARTESMRARRADGSEFDVQVSGARNRNAEGETVGCVFSIVDISDRKRADEAERELERRRVMLESLGAACHHLGQPATMLLGNLELLKDRLDAADPESRKLVQGSLDAMENLSAVLRKLTAVNEYRTTQYLQSSSQDSPGSRILEI